MLFIAGAGAAAITVGEAVGIAVGCLLLFFACFAFYYRRQKHQKEAKQ